MKKADAVIMGGGRKRECACCGNTYFRRNREERWFFDEGRWFKLIVSICTTCSKVENERKLREYKPSWLNASRTKLHSIGVGKNGNGSGRVDVSIPKRVHSYDQPLTQRVQKGHV